MIQQYCRIMDIDQDGFIDEYDFELFLKRHSYLDPHKTYDNSKYRPSSPNSVVTAQSYRVQRTVPHYKLTDQQAGNVLARLRHAMKLYNLSAIELFKTIDHNKDGFIVVDEFVYQVQ